MKNSFTGNYETFIQSPISVKTASNKSVMHEGGQRNLIPTVGLFNQQYKHGAIIPIFM